MKLSVENKRKLRFPALKFQTLLVSRASLTGEEHIGYKMETIAKKLMQNNDIKDFLVDFLADFCAGKHLILICTNTIEDQCVGDAKAPFFTSH